MTDDHTYDDMVDAAKRAYAYFAAWEIDDDDWREVIKSILNHSPYLNVALKDRCDVLEKEVAHNGQVLDALGEELKKVRGEYTVAMQRALNAEALYLRSIIYVLTLEELATNGGDESSLHVIARWRDNTIVLKPWAEDMKRRARKRALDEGILHAPGVLSVADAERLNNSYITYGDEQYSEGKQDGLQTAINIVSDEYAATPEARDALLRILNVLGDK